MRSEVEINFAGREFSHFSSDVADRVALIRRTPLFAGASLSECTSIAECARPQAFARSDLLFMQGRPLHKVTVLDSGCVKLTHLNPNGSEVILALRGSGEALHLPSVYTRCNHNFSAHAMANGKALSWNLLTMEKLVATIPKLSGNICRILSIQLSELQERYYELSAERVERRLACALIRLTSQIGTSADGGCEVSISRQELSQLIGATLFTVSRLISKWGKLGLVEPRREAVLILKPELLELMSTLDQPSPPMEQGSSLESSGRWSG